jgi:hypothetical protein
MAAHVVAVRLLTLFQRRNWRGQKNEKRIRRRKERKRKHEHQQS